MEAVPLPPAYQDMRGEIYLQVLFIDHIVYACIFVFSCISREKFRPYLAKVCQFASPCMFISIPKLVVDNREIMV